MIISTITHRVAWQITSDRYGLEKFINEANCNEIYLFPHTDFYYSYPDWGFDWPDGKMCQFHRVTTQCHICGKRPERNFAGYGSIWLLHNGISDPMVLQRDKLSGEKKWVENTPRLSRMIILCDNHIGSYFKFNSEKPKWLQTSLF